MSIQAGEKKEKSQIEKRACEMQPSETSTVPFPYVISTASSKKLPTSYSIFISFNKRGAKKAKEQCLDASLPFQPSLI